MQVLVLSIVIIPTGDWLTRPANGEAAAFYASALSMPLLSNN